MRLLPIVEGPGDVNATPVLLRRIARRIGLPNVQILRAHRRGDLFQVHRHLQRFAAVAALERAAALWLFDCDDGCAFERARELHRAVLREQFPYPFRVALIVKEYECLFLADPDACRMVLEIPAAAAFPSDPESVRGAKELLSRLMARGRAYKETIHQQALSEVVDLDRLYEKSRSYRHLENAISELAKDPATPSLNR